MALALLAGCTKEPPPVSRTVPIVVASSTIGFDWEPSPTPTPVVTVFVTPEITPSVVPSPEPSTPAPEPVVTPSPAPVVTPPPDPGSDQLVVTKGAVAPECTNSTCWHLHVKWTGLTPGPHDTQCVTDAPGIGNWSRSTYNYATSSGEKDLGCFLGYSGSHVWVIIDGTIESAHIDW